MRFGVAQIRLSNEIGTNVEKMSSYLRSAVSLGVDFLCFPECSLTGYIRDFHNIDWDEVAQGLDKLQEAVATEGVIIAVGTPHAEVSKLYNAAIVISADDRLKYFKHHLTDFDKQYFAEGQDRLSFEVKGTKCSLLICRDQDDPQLAQEYARADTKIIFFLAAHYYPMAEARRKVNKNRALPIARAVENRLFVAKANAVGSQGKYVNLGHSMIVDPEGSVVCEADEEEEKLLYYDL
ncbi:carbon-nitrogen hydrolase family protein [Chloroflexota bacterium]